MSKTSYPSDSLLKSEENLFISTLQLIAVWFYPRLHTMKRFMMKLLYPSKREFSQKRTK